MGASSLSFMFLWYAVAMSEVMACAYTFDAELRSSHVMKARTSSDGTPRSLGRIGPGLHLGTGSNRASSLREPVQRASSSQSGFTPTSVPKQAGVSQASTGA